MDRKEMIWIAIAIVAGIVIAAFAFRWQYGGSKKNGNGSKGIARHVPPSAQPRYVGFGEYYDPYSIWPFGASSNYQLFLSTNSGVPTSEVSSFGYRSASTSPSSSLYGGNGISGGR